MEMEIEESGQNLNEIGHFEKNDSSKRSNQKFINRTLGREMINIQNGEESFLELSRLSLPDSMPDFNVNHEELNNNFEQYICSICHIPKPSARLLDIHIQEDHDNFLFKRLSERQPMYECYIEKCDLKFNSQSERDEHCISIHKYAKSFGSIQHRGQLEKWESINQMSQKRKITDDLHISNKKIARDSNIIIESQEQPKSTLTFVPRQILLDKNLGINLRTHLN